MLVFSLRRPMTLVLEDSLVLEEIAVPGYERVIKVTDKKVGLTGIICMHNTVLGPTLGGTRIYPYPTFEAALNDAMRLAKGMTYKSALAGAGLGGGKSVIIADPKKQKTAALLTSFGKAVESLKGMYSCAEDSGTTTEDMMVIQKVNPYIVGLPHEKSSGNPSPFTAWGTYRGIQSVLQKMTGNSSVEGKTVAIQGLGSVGELLSELLFWAGAKLIVADIDRAKTERIAKKFHAVACLPEEILSVECDVLAPCAMGGALNTQSILRMRCKAIAGCANNQLLKDTDADDLMRRGILYAPDFVINAGGLINVTEELDPNGYQPHVSRDKVHKLYDQLLLIYDIAEQNRISTHAAAVSLGDYRLKYGIGKRTTPIHYHHSNVSLTF
jgi:leucine dehydrogenase